MIRTAFFTGILFVLLVASPPPAQAGPPLEAGFAAAEVTPPLDQGRAVWMAGYGLNRKATGVHDPLFARTVVLRIGDKKLALVSVDSIGLQLPTVDRIREQLKDFAFVVVGSTHNHETPDVIGLWGPALKCGVDDRYLDLVVEQVVASVREAEKNLTPVAASYGTAEDVSLLNDSRLPKVFDPMLRAIRFDRPGAAAGAAPAGLLVQWNCHPEALGPDNTLITADFCVATVRELQSRYHCPVVYFTGALGGLLSPPGGDRIRDAQGNPLPNNSFELADAYGTRVAELAAQAIDQAEPIALDRCVVASRRIAIPVTNSIYRTGQAMGVLKRKAYLWQDDFEKFGDEVQAYRVDRPMAIESEVAFLRLGELSIACIPGELYPELVYGQFQEPAEPNADFPDAPLERPVAKLMPTDRWLLFGLADDEIGYIIPKRQWDDQPPFAYDRPKAQYGEMNSCGPDVARAVTETLAKCVEQAAKGE